MHFTRWASPGAWTAVAWMAISASVAAQPGLPPAAPTGQPAIKQAFDAAWARQPEQLAAALRRDAARASLLAAQRWTPEPPTLELGTRTSRLTRDDGGREYEATLAVPLWLPNERARSQAAGSAQAALLEAQLAATQWRIAGEVRESYWAHERALLDADLAEHRFRSAQQLAADVARRVKAGDLARSDGHQADAAVAAAQGAIAEAAVALSSAAQRWQAITGTAPPARADLAIEPAVVPASPSPAHPMLRELQARLLVAQRQRELAGAQLRTNPELTVGAVRERGEFGERYRQAVIVGLRVPLGAKADSDSRIATASAEQLEAVAQLDLARQRIQAEIQAARVRLAALEMAASAAQRRAQLAGESRGFFDKSFRLGDTDLRTRLRVELEAIEAERHAARARLERAAAVSQLNQALGLLPE